MKTPCNGKKFTAGAAAAIALFAAACAHTYPHGQKPLAGNPGAVCIVVDASVLEKTGAGHDRFNVRANLLIAAATADKAVKIMEGLGYRVAGPPRLSAGAALDPAKQYSAVSGDGTPKIPEGAMPPFGAAPPLKEDEGKNLNALVRGLMEGRGGDMKNRLAFAPGNSVLVVECRGMSSSALVAKGPRVTSLLRPVSMWAAEKSASDYSLYLVEKETGKVLWEDNGEGDEVSSSYFANGAAVLLVGLPRAK